MSLDKAWVQNAAVFVAYSGVTSLFFPSVTVVGGVFYAAAYRIVEELTHKSGFDSEAKKNYPHLTKTASKVAGVCAGLLTAAIIGSAISLRTAIAFTIASYGVMIISKSVAGVSEESTNRFVESTFDRLNEWSSWSFDKVQQIWTRLAQ